MAQRRHHYEQAFEAFLRRRRIPYVAVDEARKALLPDGSGLRFHLNGEGSGSGRSLKSFDFVIYGGQANVLLEIKGRKIPRRSGSGRGRLESWVTLEDIESLRTWESLFGEGFEAAFAFVYWCDEQPTDALFQEVFEHRHRWYAIRAITLGNYVRSMRTRSQRWRTVHLPTAAFEALSQPLTPALAGMVEPAPEQADRMAVI